MSFSAPSSRLPLHCSQSKGHRKVHKMAQDSLWSSETSYPSNALLSVSPALSTFKRSQEPQGEPTPLHSGLDACKVPRGPNENQLLCGAGKSTGAQRQAREAGGKRAKSTVTAGGDPLKKPKLAAGCLVLSKDSCSAKTRPASSQPRDPRTD